ncbi:MAG TPA: hypothetical protein VHY58_17630 [Streptosporangiaceae bacterium]|nr:hypothetical protein [Streptosporangiaceae bacterium]
MKAGLAAVVLAAASASVLGGMAAASASPAVHPAATAPAIDHQLCYTAKTGGFKIPGNVMLENQFSPTPFTVKIGAATLHCNPVEKIVPSGQVFPINFPNDHLLCFQISESQQPTPNVVASNQFGKAKLILGQPNLLCLPSWKSLTGPPVEKTAAPPGLGHFACYPVQDVSGVYNPPPVQLQDEFSPNGPVSASVKQIPTELCVPTEKIVNGKVYKIIKPKQNLLCYPVTQTPIINPVFDKNQFGSRPVSIVQTSTLCPPTTIQVSK